MQLIKELPPLETFAVRHPVLRPGKPLETCHFEDDDLETTQHFGYYDDGTLAGVASLFKAAHVLFADENQRQLRGMAVLHHYQKNGIGQQLVKYAEKKVREQDAHLIWFNAREIAVPFYKKLGYDIIGNPFEIGDIGKHFVMFKKLT